MDSLQRAIADIESELSQIEERRSQLETALSSLRSASGQSAPKRRGRPAKVPAPRRSVKSGTRAPRGLLKKTIKEVLAAAKKPMSGSELRDGVLAAGYPSSNPKSLYTAIYVAAKNADGVRKTKDGFALGASGGGKAGSAAKTQKSAKKPGRRKAKKG